MKLEWMPVNPNSIPNQEDWPEAGRLCVVTRYGAPFLAIATLTENPKDDEYPPDCLSWKVFGIEPVTDYHRTCTILAEQDDMWAYFADEED